MPPKKGPKLNPLIKPAPPATPTVPENLDKHTTITINNEKFDIEADDLEVICELGKGSSKD
jgi:mitogen-activated protein kinase kinase 3